jgi:hypothetical protein
MVVEAIAVDLIQDMVDIPVEEAMRAGVPLMAITPVVKSTLETFVLSLLSH